MCQFEAGSSIRSKVMRGPKISKLGHVTLSHTPFEPSRDRVVGVIRNHIFGISDPNLPIHYITFMGLQRRLRGVYMGATPL